MRTTPLCGGGMPPARSSCIGARFAPGPKASARSARRRAISRPPTRSSPRGTPGCAGWSAATDGEPRPEGERMTQDEQPGIDHAQATRISREHEKARQDAIDDVAKRNSKAHEEAKRHRRADEQFRRDLTRGLER